MMKKTTLASLLILVLCLLPVTAFADAATYDAKCKVCHGADGKKLAKADLTSAAVLDKKEAELVTFLTTDAKHKSKVADEASAKKLIAYLKTLAK
jgi:cytochrome c553